MSVDPDLAAHLRHLEEELLRPEVRASAAALEALLAPDFLEIGRSGRVYDRAAIVAALADEAPADVRVEGFVARLLAPDVALATYRSVRQAGAGGAPIVDSRASIWRRDEASWRLVFHQGTPAG